jgi:hypothetical protein
MASPALARIDRRALQPAKSRPPAAFKVPWRLAARVTGFQKLGQPSGPSG